MKRIVRPLHGWLPLVWATMTCAAAGGEDARRAGFWIDVYRGEPVTYGEVLEDLAGARIVYLGECHGLERHHDIQAGIVTDLGKKGVPLVLGLEQMESFHQPQLDRYNRGEIELEQLAEATQWSQRWENYLQYRSILQGARKLGAPILALNARRETIRQVVRSGGIDKLDPQVRKELPAEMQLEDPLYEKLLNIYMMVHASATPQRLRPMLQAQIARDEVMASVLCEFLKSEEHSGRTAIVLCGSGHVNYGLGTAARVRRRMPGVKDRVILLSESGDVELSPAMKAVSRQIHVTHEQLRQIDRPIADYLHATALAATPGRD